MSWVIEARRLDRFLLHRGHAAALHRHRVMLLGRYGGRDASRCECGEVSHLPGPEEVGDTQESQKKSHCQPDLERALRKSAHGDLLSLLRLKHVDDLEGCRLVVP